MYIVHKEGGLRYCGVHVIVQKYHCAEMLLCRNRDQGKDNHIVDTPLIILCYYSLVNSTDKTAWSYRFPDQNEEKKQICYVKEISSLAPGPSSASLGLVSTSSTSSSLLTAAVKVDLLTLGALL